MEAEQKLNLYITGFGRFGNIEINPAKLVVDNLKSKNDMKELEHLNIQYVKVIGVSIEECDESIQEIKIMIEEKKKLGQDKHLIINFGVADFQEKFCLEATAKNVMDFSIPDNNGNQCRNKAINSEKDI